MNDFVKLLEEKLAGDASSQLLPFIGGVVKLAMSIVDGIKLLEQIGSLIMLILSIMLATQAFVRIIFINYYILMAPLVFACWGIPGGMGSKLVSQWFKGFLAVVFMQGVQLLVLTTMPLLVPHFPPLPGIQFGPLNEFFSQLPRIIVLVATMRVPKVMGTGPTRAIAQAGTVAGGAVTAVGGAAWSIV